MAIIVLTDRILRRLLYVRSITKVGGSQGYVPVIAYAACFVMGDDIRVSSNARPSWSSVRRGFFPIFGYIRRFN